MPGPPEQRWRVGQLARATGLTVRALHHYDELGLLVPSERTTAGHRLYVEGHVRRLYRIVALRELGLRLDAIRLVLDREQPALAEIVRRQLERVEGELERQERLRDRLARMLETLERSLEPSVDELIDAMEAMTVVTDVTEIARILGVSRQTATDLVDSAPDFPAPEGERHGRPIWARREVEAWAAGHRERRPAWRRPATSSRSQPSARTFAFMDLAAKQGKQLDHGWIGDEHLLLALADPECPGAARAALESFGLTRETIRSAIVESVGNSFPTAHNGQWLSPSTQAVLDRAELKALELRDELVSGEHALLTLLEAPADSRAAVLLADAGVDRRALAHRVIAVTDRGSYASPVPDGESPAVGEVHAAEVARILGVSRGQVAELSREGSGFPHSELGPDGYRVWSRSEIEGWAAAHPDRPPQASRLRPPAPGEVGQGTDHVLAIARAEASDLNHHGVGTDHLFLALLHPECPGEAHAVLKSLGVELDEARRRWVESMGDPFDPHDRELVVPPATHHVLEHATLAAVELEDERVTGTHVLIVLMRGWARHPQSLRPEFPADVHALHERLVQQTDGMLPVARPGPPSPHPWESLKRIPRPPELELAPSPAGHDPRKRRPWGSRVFEIPGKPWSPANGQYSIDRDGFAVLTTDGRPVGSLTDGEGRTVLDEEGNGILAPVDVPTGAEVRLHPDPS